MDAKTIVAIVLVALIIGGWIFLQVRNHNCVCQPKSLACGPEKVKQLPAG
jgi:hypothetical protein